MVDPKRLKVRCIIKGEKGHTPIRGTDYLNVDDRSEIIDMILALLPAAGAAGFDGTVLLSLDNDASDDVMSVEIDDVVYGITNATINETPVPGVYDFTVL